MPACSRRGPRPSRCRSPPSPRKRTRSRPPGGHPMTHDESGTIPMTPPRLSRRELIALVGGAGAAAWMEPLWRSGAVAHAQAMKKGGQVVVALSQEPTVFNPHRPHIEVDRGVHFGIFDSLWRVDEKAQFMPNLAVEVPTVKNGGIQKNGLEYLVKLRKDVKWHDGKPFTSKDVKFTHELIKNPKFGAFSKVGHDQVASVETPDESTLRIRLKEPFAPFMRSEEHTSELQ